MKTLFLITCTLLFATPSFAINRYDADNLTFRQLRSVLESQDAIILWYRSKNNTSLRRFGKFVNNGSACAPGEKTKSVSISLGGGETARLKTCIEVPHGVSTVSAPSTPATPNTPSTPDTNTNTDSGTDTNTDTNTNTGSNTDAL